VARHRLIAAVLSQAYHIPASLILAVATVESSGGCGPAAKVLHNHFGIVGKNYFVNQRGHKSRYKQYSSEFESYLDFCAMLTRKRFYPKLIHNRDPMAWVKAMSKAHYSEAPAEWVSKVSGVLRTICAQNNQEFLTQRFIAMK